MNIRVQELEKENTELKAEIKYLKVPLSTPQNFIQDLLATNAVTSARCNFKTFSPLRKFKGDEKLYSFSEHKLSTNQHDKNYRSYCDNANTPCNYSNTKNEKGIPHKRLFPSIIIEEESELLSNKEEPRRSEIKNIDTVKDNIQEDVVSKVSDEEGLSQEMISLNSAQQEELYKEIALTSIYNCSELYDESAMKKEEYKEKNEGLSNDSILRNEGNHNDQMLREESFLEKKSKEEKSLKKYDDISRSKFGYELAAPNTELKNTRNEFKGDKYESYNEKLKNKFDNYNELDKVKKFHKYLSEVGEKKKSDIWI